MLSVCGINVLNTMELVSSQAMPNRGNIVHITSSTYYSTILALLVSVTENKTSESLDMSFHT
jgi:hypothetical protein